jgi:uncharacterized phage protein (TIGR01671 family)
MREIKFRAWDTNFNRMWKWVKTRLSLTVNNKLLYSDIGDFINVKNLILMQYVGLKDRNGKEIYEGDIVEYLDVACDGGGDDEKHKIVIKNLETAFWFDMSFKYVGKKECEVIGNIYENPNLLK